MMLLANLNGASLADLWHACDHRSLTRLKLVTQVRQQHLLIWLLGAFDASERPVQAACTRR